jgi:hypothetical protein
LRLVAHFGEGDDAGGDEEGFDAPMLVPGPVSLLAATTGARFWRSFCFIVVRW